MTALRRQTVFASLDQPQAWPRDPRAAAAASGSTPSSTRCRASASTLKRKLEKLGLETIRDLLEHRPHRYESAVDEVAIAALGG